MSISKELIEILACPKCKGDLIYRENEAFICKNCKLLYPIRDGIPVMLIDEAQPVQAGKTEG
jgi:hypothetical protein